MFVRFVFSTNVCSTIGQINIYVFYTNIDQALVNALHGLLNCEISGLHCRVITTEYITHCIHM